MDLIKVFASPRCIIPLPYPSLKANKLFSLHTPHSHRHFKYPCFPSFHKSLKHSLFFSQERSSSFHTDSAATLNDISELTITKNVWKILNELKMQRKSPEIFLEIGIAIAGCQGFQYSFTVHTHKTITNHRVFSHPNDSNIHILIDPISFSWLKGSTVDFSNEVFNSHFVIDNPLTKKWCSCGQSFSLYGENNETTENGQSRCGTKFM